MVECPLKIAVTDLSSSLMGQTFTQTRKDKVRAVLTTFDRVNDRTTCIAFLFFFKYFNTFNHKS